MNVYEREAVIEVIEQLVAELHPDNVPSEIDVEGALKVLNQEEEVNAREEEGTEAEMGEEAPQPA